MNRSFCLFALATLIAVAACRTEFDDTDDELVFDFDVPSDDDQLLSVSSHRPGDRSIHIADIDLCEPGIELIATGPSTGRRTVRSFAQMHNAIVAINGGHSWNNVPAISAHNGQFFGSPDQPDVGQAVFGDGLAEFVHMHASYASRPSHKEVMSGLLTLVHDGNVQGDLPTTGNTCAPQHPRTLLGLTQDKRRLIMVVVDGRAPQAGRRGMTCRESADLMKFLGAHWGLNLDGGGSSEMVHNGRIVNVPSDGQERVVPTHLAVVRRPGARGHCPTAPTQPPPEPPPATCGVLGVNEALGVGQSMTSCNGRFHLAHQGDGNVVLYDTASTVRALWSTRTNGKATATFVMQGDGNVVLYAASGNALWSSRTNGRNGATLRVQDDGNLVVRAGNSVVWQSNTVTTTAPPPPPPPAPAPPPPTTQPPPAPAPPPAAPPASPPPACGRLDPNQALARGQAAASCDGRFVLTHQTDGNVVLRQNGIAIWSTSTAGRATSTFVMQGDGNLVLYNGGSAVWHTGTHGNANAFLAIQDDGNAVIYRGAAVKWQTRTCCR